MLSERRLIQCKRNASFQFVNKKHKFSRDELGCGLACIVAMTGNNTKKCYKSRGAGWERDELLSTMGVRYIIERLMSAVFGYSQISSIMHDTYADLSIIHHSSRKMFNGGDRLRLDDHKLRWRVVVDQPAT